MSKECTRNNSHYEERIYKMTSKNRRLSQTVIWRHLMPILQWKSTTTDYRSLSLTIRKMANRKQSQRKQSASQSPQPSTSGPKHEDLIKELTHSKLFHDYLADMIIHCIASIQSKLEDLSAAVSAIDESIVSQQNSIKELQTITEELKSVPNESISSTTNNKDFLLRIHGLDGLESSDICESFCTVVSSKMGIPCLPNQFTRLETGAHDEPSHSTTTRRKVHTIKVDNQSMWNQIYRARTMLKGTSIFISEVLSSSNQFLFFLSRKMKKDSRIAATWSYKGNIYIRTLQDDHIKHIRSPSDLATYWF